MFLKKLAVDFTHLFYPEVCLGCRTSLHDGEDIVCLTCASQLPVAYDLLESDEKVKELFYGRSHIEHARSLLFYEKIGVVQELIHQLKYDGQERISGFLGEWMAQKIKKDPFYDTITHVVPVPVHPVRLKKRGYNQVTDFGKAIATHKNSTFLPNLLLKTKNTINQARLGQVKRSDETQNPYALNTSIAIDQDAHILLVDDVITTGTTLSMCVTALAELKDVKISIATMAISV